MPGVNVRLTAEQHSELIKSAANSGRSLQREIIYRIFPPAVIAGTNSRVTVTFADPKPAPRERKRSSLSRVPRAAESSPKRKTGCAADVAFGTKCKLCGSYH